MTKEEAYYYLEKYLPSISGLLGLFLFLTYTFLYNNRVPEGIGDAISQSVSLGGIFAGFLYTAKSLLFALPDRPLVKRIAEMGALERLISFISSSVYHWIFVSFLSLTYIIINSAVGETGNYLIQCVWVGAVFTAAASFFRSVRLVSKLLKETT